MKVEYKIIELYYEGIEEAIEENAEDGWEYVDCIPYKYDDANSAKKLIFKRPKKVL